MRPGACVIITSAKATTRIKIKEATIAGGRGKGRGGRSRVCVNRGAWSAGWRRLGQFEVARDICRSPQGRRTSRLQGVPR
jgi:hypothetical protein